MSNTLNPRARAAAERFKAALPRRGPAGNALYVYGVIGDDGMGGGITALDVAQQLDGMAKSGAKTVDVYINSPGGSVFDGLAIAASIKRFPGTSTAHVDGLAASIASVIAMAADRVVMDPAAQLMIHNAHVLTAGDASSLRETADIVQKLSADSILTAYSRTGLPAEQLQAMMDRETWMNAREAVNLGFADAIEGADEVAQPRIAARVSIGDLLAYKLARAKRR